MMDSARKGTAPLSHNFGDQGSRVLFEENVQRTKGWEGGLEWMDEGRAEGSVSSFPAPRSQCWLFSETELLISKTRMSR